jgi:aminoglycoside phosphotransferase (APT) family kinase protein
MSDHDRLAAEAARRWELPPPELLRRGMASVYATGDDTVVRVAPATESVLALPAFLEAVSEVDVRVPELRRDPLVTGDVVVIAMQRVRAVAEVDWRAVGQMVRRLHSLDADGVAGLPWCGDFAHWRIEELLAEVGHAIDRSALAGMRQRLERAGDWRAAMRAAPQVVCHGDLHPGNVVQSADGPVLLDWDLRCCGPVAWDHGPLLRWGDRWTQAWGGGPGSYERFAEGYGSSMHADPLTVALAELRLLVATLMRMRAAMADPVASAEAQRRLAYWRGEVGAPLWNPQ